MQAIQIPIHPYEIICCENMRRCWSRGHKHGQVQALLQSFRFLVMMDESVFLGALVVTSKTPAWGNEICQLPPLQTRTRPQEHGCQLLRV